MKISLVPLAMLTLFLGCSSPKKMDAVNADLSHGRLLTPQQAKQLEKAMTDTDIANMLDVKVKAKLPTYMAVARLQQGWYSNSGKSYPEGLTTITSDEIEGWEKAISGESILGVRGIPSLSLDGSAHTLYDFRQSAARMGCEILLVYLRADGSVDNFNDAAVLYWTVAGLWLAPGNTYERKTVMQALLVDCRTGMILGTAAGTSTAKTSYAAAYDKIAQATLDERTPVEALADLQKNSTRMIRQVVRLAQAHDSK